MIRFVAACILFCATLLARAATLELQIPQQHPYLAMNPADIARATERVACLAGCINVGDKLHKSSCRRLG